MFVANPPSATFAAGLQIYQIAQVHKVADLRFAELNIGPHTLANMLFHKKA
jgi:hypothetical protein